MKSMWTWTLRVEDMDEMGEAQGLSCLTSLHNGRRFRADLSIVRNWRETDILRPSVSSLFIISFFMVWFMALAYFI